MRSVVKYFCLIFVSTILLFGCDVHEWPDTPEDVTISLKLNYDTDMTIWNHVLNSKENVITEIGYGETSQSVAEEGFIRYIVRVYPILNGNVSYKEHFKEFTASKNVSSGYNHEMLITLPSGNYEIMVWSDLKDNWSDTSFYFTEDFTSIQLNKNTNFSNTDYRDAFRGKAKIQLVADVLEKDPEVVNIAMERPLAKYEFIATDLNDFIQKELLRIASKKSAETGESVDKSSIKIDLDDYTIKFKYYGYIPDIYSVETDRPIDSRTDIIYESKISQFNSEEVSIGFDYVFVNNNKSAVTMQIGIYDNDNTEVSLSKKMDIPLLRSHHTIIKGAFLTTETSGGVSINPSFDNEYNWVFPK